MHMTPCKIGLNLLTQLVFSCLVGKITRNVAPKPAVPKNGDKPIHGLVSDKNFIVANAVENILAGKCTSVNQTGW